MKKTIAVMLAFCALPAFANYDYNYSYDGTPRRDTYVGFRVHKNENIAFRFEPENSEGTTLRDDGFGIGINVGNRLTDNVKIEFETAYTGGRASKYGNDFDFDIWSNMLNVYVYKQFGGAVEPYGGFGIGISGIWGNVDGAMNMSDSTADMSWAAMIGVNFALNARIDLNIGLKYQNYGDIEMRTDDDVVTSTEIDGTEFYIGAVYKFGL